VQLAVRGAQPRAQPPPCARLCTPAIYPHDAPGVFLRLKRQRWSSPQKKVPFGVMATENGITPTRLKCRRRPAAMVALLLLVLPPNAGLPPRLLHVGRGGQVVNKMIDEDYTEKGGFE
jgi:hypothetical protein